MKQSWSIVVFCYNEADTIRELLDLLVLIFEEHRKGLYEIIVVDDGSRDGTRERIAAAQSARPDVIRVVTHEHNKGIGETLRDGYVAATNENLTAIPGDAQFDVRELIPYLNIEKDTFVSFYRLENVQYTAFRSFLSYFNKKLNALFIGMSLKDVNWVKIYKTQDIKTFPWELHSSLIESELCAKLLKSGKRVVEVLSYYHPRLSGVSKGASLSIILKAAQETLKLILIMRKFKARV